MDPDETLSELRTLVFIASTITDGGGVGDWHAALMMLIETFKELDDHIAAGGALPIQWDVPRDQPIDDTE